MSLSDDTLPCPHCGTEIPVDVRMCRHCGFSDEYDDAAGDDGQSADDDFDYDEFVAREFPESADPDSAPVRRQAWLQLIVAAIVLSFILSIVVWGQ